MRGKRMAELNRPCDSHLPSAALPASGSRGSSTTSQPIAAPPHLSREATASTQQVNDRLRELIVITYLLFVRRSRPTSLRQGYDLASTVASTPNLRGRPRPLW